MWLTGIDNPYGVAATSTLLAVSHTTPTQARVLVYDVGGTLVTVIGGDALDEGNPCCVGVRLGLPSSIAVRASLL